MKHVDVIVIGGGHAGAEAAHAAARAGADTCLVTLDPTKIGVMSCNPAIGGLGKGHLVREIDALDGIMGRAADRAGIQFRLLNRRKGPAVQGPRAQADRALYRSAVQRSLRDRAGLTIIAGEVASLLLAGGSAIGVVLADGQTIRARSVVITAGTFLRGVMHIGDRKVAGGRVGDRTSVLLADQLAALGLPLGRLKTGTPPRLDGRTIDWGRVGTQDGDDVPSMFSFLHERPFVRQVPCGITQTNERTHDVVRRNLARSAMYGGHIEGVGPRYCPSIEDKVLRFSDKASHQVFLEPEGLDDTTVYPNGLSTSLPPEVQEEYIRSIAGLEAADILQSGYAIEYDFVDPRALRPDLSLRELDGVFLAGQINGTTGYEEAAAQGLVAGLNAARRARGLEPAIFERTDSYIGVMIDDLVTRGVTEPYRMFTSRAEYRLSLRADNADQRLTPLGCELGLVQEKRRQAFDMKMEQIERGKTELLRMRLSLADVAPGKDAAPAARRPASELLAQPDVHVEDIARLSPVLSGLPKDVLAQLKSDATYAGYIRRQAADVEALRRDEATLIPEGFAYGSISGLSGELKSKLEHIRPRSLGQASRVEGMTPAALTLLLAMVRKQSSRQAVSG